MNKNTLFVLKSLKLCCMAKDNPIVCMSCPYYPIDNCQEALLEATDGVIDTIETVERLKKIYPRCDKCVRWRYCSRNKDNENNCPDYKRDPPDGGGY